MKASLISSFPRTRGRLESSSCQFAASGRLAGLPLTFVPPDRLGESVGGSIRRRVCLHFTSLYRALISKAGPAAPPSLCQESLSSSDQILMPRYSTRSLIHSQLILSVNYLLILRCAVRSPGGYIDQGSEYIIDFLSSHPASRHPSTPTRVACALFFCLLPPAPEPFLYFHISPPSFIPRLSFLVYVCLLSLNVCLCAVFTGGSRSGALA